MSTEKVVKKFYRDLSSEEEEYIENVLAEMQDKELYVAESARSKIDDSVIWDDIMETLDEGVPYEISNEGVGRTDNPFRIVLAKEFSNDDPFTVFVKVVPDMNGRNEVVLDFWKRRGSMPIYPPPHSVHQFVQDWDIITDLESAQYKKALSVS